MGNDRLGFFAPEHVDRFVSRVDFSLINVYPDGERVDLSRLEENLRDIAPFPHRLHLNLTPALVVPRSPSELIQSDVDSRGRKRRKLFSPKPKHKVWRFLGEEEMARRLAGLPSLIQKYRHHIGVL